MDDLKTLAPFLIAINRVVQDAVAFGEDDIGLDRHFKAVVHEEVSRTQTSLAAPSKLHVLHIPTESAAIRRNAMPQEEFSGIEPATPIRPFQIHALQPDEIIHGWHGRIRAINCLPEKANIAREIAKAASQQNAMLTPDADAVQHAASLLGVNREALLERHTLTPFFDAIEGLKPNKPGTKSSRHKSDYKRRAPFRLEGDHPRFCTQCAEVDVERLGFSYWRRIHQLPGMLWCQRHGVKLSLARSRVAFAICPHQVTDTLVNENISQLTSGQAKLMRRYAYLAAEILNQAPSIDSGAASTTLGQWAKTQNLRFTKNGKRQTVSSHIIDVMPSWWLRDTFPRVHWSPNSHIWTVDGACSPGATRYTSSSLCLLAAVLCDAPDQAVKILWSRRNSEAKSLGPDFWASRAAFDAYVAHRGNVSRVAEALNLPNSSVAIGLLKQGLPGLGKATAMAKAIRTFLDGDSLINASTKHGVSMTDLEEMLRSGCMRLKTAMDAIARQDKHALIKPLYPHSDKPKEAAA